MIFSLPPDIKEATQLIYVCLDNNQVWNDENKAQGYDVIEEVEKDRNCIGVWVRKPNGRLAFIKVEVIDAWEEEEADVA